MKKTILTAFKVPGSILIALSITLLFLALMHFAQPHFASAGGHRLATISWDG